MPQADNGLAVSNFDQFTFFQFSRGNQVISIFLVQLYVTNTSICQTLISFF